MAALAAFLVINLILGGIVDPYLCGRKLNIATRVILISLLVWQGLLGLIGILLAVPLTMTLKLIIEQVDGGARWKGERSTNVSQPLSMANACW